VRAAIGATSLSYLSLDGLIAATRRPAASLCTACLTGDYPTRVPLHTRKLRFEPAVVGEDVSSSDQPAFAAP
jgi:glutamine phosphoribosylpyrophosphate amidotransferase